MQTFNQHQQKENTSLEIGHTLHNRSEEQMAAATPAGMRPNPKNGMIQMKPEMQKQGVGSLLSGTVFFTGCEGQLENFFMIPEESGTPGFHPTGRRVDNIDGFWFKYHTPKSEWWKIPAFATTYVNCNEGDEQNPEIIHATLPFANHGWTDDGIHTPNPF